MALLLRHSRHRRRTTRGSRWAAIATACATASLGAGASSAASDIPAQLQCPSGIGPLIQFNRTAQPFPVAREISACGGRPGFTCCTAAHDDTLSRLRATCTVAAELSPRCCDALSSLHCLACEARAALDGVKPCKSLCLRLLAACGTQAFAWDAAAAHASPCSSDALMCAPLKEFASTPEEACRWLGYPLHESRLTCYDGAPLKPLTPDVEAALVQLAVERPVVEEKQARGRYGRRRGSFSGADVDATVTAADAEQFRTGIAVVDAALAALPGLPLYIVTCVAAAVLAVMLARKDLVAAWRSRGVQRAVDDEDDDVDGTGAGDDDAVARRAVDAVSRAQLLRDAAMRRMLQQAVDSGGSADADVTPAGVAVERDGVGGPGAQGEED